MILTTSVTMTQMVLLGLGAGCLLIAALHDIAARTIPNWSCLGVFALGLVLRVQDGHLGLALLLSLAVLLVTTVFWRRGWLGGGDVKLLTATAMFVPPAAVVPMLAMVSMVGGVVTMIYVVAPMLLKSAPHRPPASRADTLWRRVLCAERRRLGRGGPLPYGPAIAVGTLLTTFLS